MKVEFWFDFASSYSYPAAMSVEHMAKRQNLDIAWRPFLLGAIFNKQGWQDSPFNLHPAKGAYMWRDLERVCRESGLSFTRPSQFPRNGLLAARVASAFATAPWLADFIRAVFTANFADDLDISSPSVIARCLEMSGEDSVAIIKAANSPATKSLLREQTELAYQKGIFGAPSFLVGKELFWGNDRLTSALSWAVNQGN
ncbi:2-hydroxychromene-2-carboxylate isomerase [Thalassomonas viridans]|uniref:2-hydroxychromene-2-carboxylate isomerase n=1 Tax=Thalassomonas viridans TaxID=137584 RepID=A0AAF0C5C3_9GAMM|nr:2-hydroxychromene-2-carboxylate isomerase [Thalassomonas viridans]WDE03177.1 2-hydroxychromene-2-carboxylate isomerase [Thalassomonas viridans]